MCGIVGVIAAYQNGFSSDEQNMFRDMLFLDTQRGWDSTGVFLVENNSNVHIRKAAIHGPDFIRHKEFNTLKQKAWSTGMFMVGHNRAATKGSVTDANAHPFWVDDNIVLVQNGTYIGSHKHHKDVEVDTEAVAHVIAEHEDIEQALQRINAAYALVWYNVKKKTLYLIRNEDRPLWIATTKDGGVLFASEYETILYAASRSKVKIKGNVELMVPGVLHSFRLEDKKWYSSTTKLDYKFRREHAPATTGYEDYYEELESWRKYKQYMGMGATRHDYMPPVDLTSVRQAVEATSGGRHKDKTLYDYVKEGKFQEFYVDDNEEKIIRAWHDTVKPDTILVEFAEYLELSDDPNNPQWLVYGYLVRAVESEPSPLVYVRLQGITEIEALDFTSAGLYTLKPTSGMVTHTMGKDKLVTLFCTDPIRVVNKEKAEQVH